MMRRSKFINDLVIWLLGTVGEGMQLYDQFKMSMEIHKEHVKLLSEDINKNEEI